MVGKKGSGHVFNSIVPTAENSGSVSVIYRHSCWALSGKGLLERRRMRASESCRGMQLPQKSVAWPRS